jgi:hypothetical protein
MLWLMAVGNLFRRHRRSPSGARPHGRRQPLVLEALEDRRLLAGFPGIGQTQFLPPDPSGAAGPNSLIETVNTRISLYAKNGALLQTADMDSPSGGNFAFFRTVRHGFGFTDPWVIYDRYADRFMVMATEIQSGAGANQAYFDIAISITNNPADLDVAAGDPSPDWYFYSIPVSSALGTAWADYPKLAADANSLYITGNYFRFSGGFAGVAVTKLDKTPMLSGTLGARTDAVASGAFTLQPVQGIGRSATDPELFVDRLSSGIRVWEMNSSGVLTARTTLASSNSTIGGAPQSGTTATLDSLSGEGLIYAVWRNNSIWTAHTVSFGGKGAVRWYEITTTGGTYGLRETGTIDAGSGVWTIIPALAVDAAGNMGITYTQTSSSQFPAMMTAAHLATDPLGFTQPGTVQHASSTFYNPGLANPQRWGDYAAMSVDPSDDRTFWAFHEYAAGTNSWGTWVSSFTLNTNLPPTLDPIPDQTIPSTQNVLNVTLHATDPDGDPITYSATAQSRAYVLTQQTGTLTYFSIYDNYGGRNEKWLQANGSGQWYFILPTGEFYRWDGGVGANGTLLGNVGASYWTDPTRLVNPPANQPHATLGISGNTLTITRDPAWISGMVVTATASDGQLSDSKSFNVVVTSTNTPPVLSPIPDQTIPSGQQVLNVSLSASDPDGDPLSFLVTAQSTAYVLTQQTGTLTYFNVWDNYGGRGEKWLQANGGQWYFILANGELYQWDGGSGATGTLLGNVGASYWTDPTRLVNPPANQPHATFSISGNTLTITRDLAWISGMVVTVTVSDGTFTDSKTFKVIVTP